MRERRMTDAEASAWYGVEAGDDGTMVPGVTQNNWGPDYVRHTRRLSGVAALANNLRPYLVESDAGEAQHDRVGVRAGRFSLDGDAFVFAGGIVELPGGGGDGTYYLFVQEDEPGVGEAVAVTSGTDWPGGFHLKVAELEVADGVLSLAADRRLDEVFAG